MTLKGILKNITEQPKGYYKRHRHEMVDFLPKTAKTLLDIGCGIGTFGEVLKEEMGVEVWGVEKNEKAAEEAARKVDKVLRGDICEVYSQLPDKYFECIVFNDVIEHFVDPYIVLQQIKSKLKSDGVVVCSIPNVRYYENLFDLLFRKQWKYEEQGILDKTHLRFFTEKSIKDMFKMLDYEILEMRGINRTRNKKARFLNWISFGWLSDILYLQYGCKVKSLKK